MDDAKIVPFMGQETTRIRATPFIPRPPSSLPRQQFLYGFELQRGHVSALIAPGAAGKSTYLTLFRSCLTQAVEVGEPNVQALISELKAREIDHLDVDPFVSSHGVPENDNGMIDLVAKEWAYIAAEANCSISLAHHIKKIEGREATALDARGASSLLNACRSGLVINRMSGEQADACGVPLRERRFYFSMVDGKNNRAPPATKADWFRLIGVGLGNSDVGCPGPEDQVATISAFTPPSLWGGFNAKQLSWVQDGITTAGVENCRAHSASPKWVGFVIADLLDIPVVRGPSGAIDKCEGKSKLVTMIAAWIENDIIKVENRMVNRSELKPCVVAGPPVPPDEI
jgi:hypothetical protein